MNLVIGTAGWSIPARDAAAFPADGASLERYAARLAGAEINSSFHRPHRRSTWEKWAASVPPHFRFSVKLPKTITHQLKLRGCTEPLRQHLADAGALGAKLAVHLVQLPPSLAYDEALADSFFAEMRELAGAAAIACEPRHPSWFEPAADSLLERRQVARVAADPARVPAAAQPGGWRGLAYFRLHGSPVMYRSSYRDGRLEAYADRLRDAGATGWCIFDNTASSEAMGDALALLTLLDERGRSRGTEAG
jgi:uncharacterized protein YecE (DUF72 family)